MKNNLKYFIIFALSCLVIFSCKKKSDDSLESLPFAKETVDEGKTNLSEAGSDLLVQTEALKDADGMEAIRSLKNCNDQDDVLKSAPVLATLSEVGKISEGAKVFNLLRSGLKAGSDTTLQEVFDSHTGIYTWNFTTKLWDKTSATGKIEFNFPSKETGTTNNAKLVITYKGKAGISIIEGYDGDMPLNLNATLSVNNTKVAETDLTVTYNSDGTPASVVYFIAVYPFKVELSATYNASSASVKYSFTNGTTIIVECYVGVNGNLSKQNIEDAQNSDKGPEDIISNANAYFQVFNIKLAGEVNVKGLADAMNSIDKNTSLTDEQAGKAMADAINSNAALILHYVDTKAKIAQAEAYYSPEDQDVDLRCIFADGSKGDIESYLNSGFQDLFNDINAFIVELNTDFDLDIEPVEYPVPEN